MISKDGKKRWVVFVPGAQPRVYTGRLPKQPKEAVVIKNPDFTHVWGVPQSKWSHSKGQLTPGWSKPIKTFKIDPHVGRRSRMRTIMASFLVGAALGTIIGVMLNVTLY
jgi:hypothetical protein